MAPLVVPSLLAITSSSDVAKTHSIRATAGNGALFSV